MFDRKPELIKINLGIINHKAPTIYEALGVEKKIFNKCIKKTAQNSKQDLACKNQISWDDLMAFQDKILTKRISKLWEIRKRTYEISLETFVETILVFRSFVTDCVPCGSGDDFKLGMLSPKNEIGACVTLNCHASGLDGHHGY